MEIWISSSKEKAQIMLACRPFYTLKIPAPRKLPVFEKLFKDLNTVTETVVEYDNGGSPVIIEPNLTLTDPDDDLIIQGNGNHTGFSVLMAQIKSGGAYRLGYAFEVPAGNSVGTRFTTHELSFGLNLGCLIFIVPLITTFQA